MSGSANTLECCSNNIDFGAWNRLLESEFSVSKQYCLQRCGLCHTEHFLIQNGNLMIGTDHDTMIDSLLEDYDE